jgi:hypothetical protein
MLVQHANTQQQHTIMRMVQAVPAPVCPQGPHNQKLFETGGSESRQTQRTQKRNSEGNLQGTNTIQIKKDITKDFANGGW